MRKLFVFVILIITLSSCISCINQDSRGDYDDLNKYKGEIVASKDSNAGNGYFLYLKKENNANLTCVKVSCGEYDYYQKGDIIK